MLTIHWLCSAFVLAVAFAPSVRAQTSQTCEGGAYLNPQLFRDEATLRSALAQQEMRDFVAGTGLPTTPLYAIKRVDDITASGRAPYCWAYANPLSSGSIKRGQASPHAKPWHLPLT